MQIRQVEYFLTLCEELNFTRAARRCGISQPSLTNAIRSLEAELGGALFCRKPATQLSERGKAAPTNFFQLNRFSCDFLHFTNPSIGLKLSLMIDAGGKSLAR